MGNEKEVFLNLHDNHGGNSSESKEKDTPLHQLDIDVDHQVVSELARRTVAGMLVAISSGAELARRVKTYIDGRQRDGRSTAQHKK